MEGKELIQTWISTDMKEEIRLLSKRDDISISSWVRKVLKSHLDAQRSPKSVRKS